MTASTPDRLVIGCMTGTSIDAIDAALVRIRGQGLAMHAEFLHGVSLPLESLAPRLRTLADQHPTTAGHITQLSRDFALAHAIAIRTLLKESNARLEAQPSPAFICVHGQTIYHAPPLSWQMFSAPILALELNLPVVSDLRAADLAAGGQGAPITPLADWILFRSEHRTAVVNLGGFANATLLPATNNKLSTAEQITEIDGFDICACNHLLDRVARDVLHLPYDDGGSRALAGQPHPGAVEDFTTILRNQSRARRSLGTGDETGQQVQRWASILTPNDLAASACHAIADTIAARLGSVSTILVAGGGARNTALVQALRQHSGRDVLPTDARPPGLPIEFREAAEMAILGALCADRVPITLAQITGVRSPAPVAGVWAGR